MACEQRNAREIAGRGTDGIIATQHATPTIPFVISRSCWSLCWLGEKLLWILVPHSPIVGFLSAVLDQRLQSMVNLAGSDNVCG